MKMLFKILILVFILNEIAFAGFGRGGSSGSSRGFSSGGSRSYASSRSYSAPRQTYYSQPRTVIREYHHTNTVHAPSSGGGGIHPLTAGIAGYLVGDALNRNHSAPAQQPPQVVYVNGQPQQVNPQSNVAPVNPENLPPASQYQYQAPEPTNKTEEKGGSLILILLGILSLLFFGTVFYQLGKRAN